MADEVTQTVPATNAPPAAQTTQQPPVQPPTPAPVVQQPTVSPVESTYTREEIIAAAKSFGTTSHLVAGALHGQKKTQFTKSEAQALIDAYKKKEVK